MLQTNQVEELVTVLTALDREALINQFANYRATFPIDFTREFLDAQDTNRLRHLFLAICLQSKRMPELPVAA